MSDTCHRGYGVHETRAEEQVLTERGVRAGRDAVLGTLPFALDTRRSVSHTCVSVPSTLFSVAITRGSVRGAPIQGYLAYKKTTPPWDRQMALL